jgi:acetyltransferase-like isoleucine patch superfamily enzyme
VTGTRRTLENDWYAGEIPANVVLEDQAYLDTTYSFAQFNSQREPGLVMGYAAGAYNRTVFIVGSGGRVEVGAFSILNETNLVCNESVTIGSFCLLSWGVFITDCWSPHELTLAQRSAILSATAIDPRRPFPPVGRSRPVSIGDNVWVGFGSVILPGVNLGDGCIVGCKTIVDRDVPPYAVVVGDPPRIVRHLEPGESALMMQTALRTENRESR